MQSTSFERIWYRQEPRKGVWPIWAWQDVGTLAINGDYLEYQCGKQQLRIPIEAINKLKVQKQGTDWVNKWIKIEYDPDLAAYFADGRLLGWHGLFGGTRELLHALVDEVQNKRLLSI